jgi:hypothetical protein
MNATCTALRDALDAGADCRFALVDALMEDGETELAELYRVPLLVDDTPDAFVRRMRNMILKAFGIPKELVGASESSIYAFLRASDRAAYEQLMAPYRRFDPS